MLKRLLSVRQVARPMDGVVFGAVLILGIAGLVSWLTFDHGAVDFLAPTRSISHSSLWAAVINRLGKAWLQIWLLLIWFLVSRRRHEVLAGLLAMILVGMAVNPVKLAVGRPRPHDMRRAEAAGLPEQSFTRRVSFPSADTATAFGIATAVLPAFGWPVRLLLLGGCAAVGTLRVVSLAHYPSDVFIGAAIGFLAGWLAIRLVDRWGVWDQTLPHENELMLGVLIGIPIIIGLSEGPTELLFLLKTYGVLILFLFLGAKTVAAWKKRTRPRTVPVPVARIVRKDRSGPRRHAWRQRVTPRGRAAARSYKGV